MSGGDGGDEVGTELVVCNEMAPASDKHPGAASVGMGVTSRPVIGVHSAEGTASALCLFLEFLWMFFHHGLFGRFHVSPGSLSVALLTWALAENLHAMPSGLCGR